MMLQLVDFIICFAVLFFLYQLRRKKIQLSICILYSLFFAMAYGFFLKLTTPHESFIFLSGLLRLIGYGYLALLKMLVIPLILTSIIHAILKLGAQDGRFIKNVSFLSCFILLGTTALASLIAIVIGKLFHVGMGLQLPMISDMPKHPYTGLTDTLLAMLPSNPVLIMTQENTVAIVLFAILLGIAAHMLDEKDHDKMHTFRQLIDSLFAIVKKLAVLILNFTPYGVFALLSLLLFEQGNTLIFGMLRFLSAMYTAMFFVLILHGILITLAGQNFWQYLKKAFVPLFVAFTTRSSFGTLPITEETLHNKFKVNQVIATFVPSLGATIGMNACAGVFPAMLVVMTMTIMHQPLTMHVILMVMLINAIASLGISGIPGTAFIAATVTLTSLNLPYAIIALVQGIDPIIDMGRTAVNVNGAMTTALVVDRLYAKKTIPINEN